MKQVKLQSFYISYKDEISQLYESGELFEIEIDSNFDKAQKATIEIINLLLKNPKFNEMNALITKQYKLSDYFFEVHYYLETLFNNADLGKPFELSLESETIKGIYVRANFTEKDLRRMKYFRKEYDREDMMRLGPDYNYDIRVIRRASIDLLYKKLYSGNKRYLDLDLSSMHLWDHMFGLP